MMEYKKISSFDAAERLPQYRKDDAEEDILELINKQLVSIQGHLEAAALNTGHGILLILGVPRSGTTLLHQVLASRLDVGYCSNLMARFYEAPAVGAFLQSGLIGNRLQNQRKYKSTHGVTKNIEEPHEFGYFWSRHLGVCNDTHEPNDGDIINVNIERLNAELQSVISVFNKSVVFKCLLGNFFISVLKKIPNVFFLDMHRNLIDLALSFWRVREERLGSVHKWWSIRPGNYTELKELNPVQQIVGQITAIRNAVTRDLATVEDNRKAVIHYESLVKAPERIVDELVKKFVAAGFHIEKVGEPIPELQFPKKREIDNDLLSEFKRAFEELTMNKYQELEVSYG